MLNFKKFLILFYTTEIFYRFIYILFSFCICLIITFYYIELLMLLETYPFLKFTNKKFIITHTTDLINSIWYLTFSTSFFLIFPLFFYHIINFAKAGWYEYQTIFAEKLLHFPLIMCYSFVFFCYYSFFPSILNFLTQWDLVTINSVLNIEIEFRVLNYIEWILMLRNSFAFLIYIIYILILQFSFFIFLIDIYKIMKFHRKKFCFLTITYLFILMPSDIFLQFFTIIIIFIIYELNFFIICYKIYNSKYANY
uniref:SecY n=1 Tax=Riquetophycus sp. HSY-2014a TaxID=1488470 RepID=A0A0E3DBK7_9FLOR|nr:SecY [Riquetophycus sp. HSY-2014a]